MVVPDEDGFIPDDGFIADDADSFTSDTEITSVEVTNIEEPVATSFAPDEDGFIPDDSGFVPEQQTPIETTTPKIGVEGQEPLGFLDRIKETKATELLPFVSDAANIVDATKLFVAMKKVEKETASPEDVSLVTEFLDKSERDTDLGFKVAEVLVALPSFAGELFLTGGIFTAGKKASKEAVELGIKKLAGKQGKKILRSKIAKLGVKVAGGIGGATLQTIPARGLGVVAGAIERVTPKVFLTKDEVTGAEEFTFKKGEDIVPAVAKSLGTEWVEVVSEKSGGLFKELASPVRSALVKRGLVISFLKLNPGSKLDDFVKLQRRLGWDGVLEEMGEERLGELGRAALGIEEYKLPSREQVAAEAIAFMVPGVTVAGVSKLVEGKGKATKPIVEEPLEQQVEVFNKEVDTSTEKIVKAREAIKESQETIVDPVVLEQEKVIEQEEIASLEEKGISTEVIEELVIEKQTELAQPISQPEKIITQEKTPKTQILKETGVKKSSDEIKTTKQKLFKEQLRIKQKVSKESFKLGVAEERSRVKEFIKEEKTNLKQAKAEVVKFANEQLPFEERGRIITKLKNLTKASDKEKTISFIEEIADKVEKKTAIKSIKGTLSKIKKTDKTKFKAIRPEFIGKIDSLFEEVTTQKAGKKKILKAVSMRDFLEDSPDNIIPTSKLKILDVLSKKSIDDMSLKEVKILEESINAIVKINTLKNKLIVKGIQREHKEVVQEAVSNLNTKKEADSEPDNVFVSDAQEENKSGFKIFDSKSINTEFIGEMFDKKDNGVIQKVVYSGIDEGRTEELRAKHEGEDFVKDKIKGIDVSTWSRSFFTEKAWKKQREKSLKEIKLPSGAKLNITKGDKIAIYLSSLNEDSRRHMVEGGVSPSGKQTKVVRVTQDDLTHISDSMTEEELQVADAMYEYYNSLQKGKINKVSRKVNGFDVAGIEHYYPINTNSLSITPSGISEAQTLDNMQPFFLKTLGGMGILQERKEGATNPLILDDAFIAFSKYNKLSSSYIGLSEPLRNAKSLIKDPDFQTAVINNYGRPYLSVLQSYIRSIEGNATNIDEIDRVVNDANNRLTVAVLGLNPFVASKQTASYLLAGTEMEAKYLARATTPELKETMSKWSPQIRERLRGKVTREMAELSSSSESRNTFIDKKDIGQRSMAWVSYMDYQAIGRIYKAVRFKMEETTALKGDVLETAIAREAERVIRRTQPTFDIKDRSEISRNSHPLMRLWTKFSSQRNKNYIIKRRSVGKYNRSSKSIKDKMVLIKNLSIVYIMTPLLIMAINRIRAWMFGREKPKDEEEKLGLALNMVVDIIELNVGDLYHVGTAFSALRRKIRFGSFTTGVDNLLLSSVNEMGNVIVGTIKAVEQVVTQERYNTRNKDLGIKAGELKFKKTVKNLVKPTISTIGKIKGQPIIGVANMAELALNFVKSFEGKVSPQKRGEKIIKVNKDLGEGLALLNDLREQQLGEAVTTSERKKIRASIRRKQENLRKEARKLKRTF